MKAVVSPSRRGGQRARYRCPSRLYFMPLRFGVNTPGTGSSTLRLPPQAGRRGGAARDAPTRSRRWEPGPGGRRHELRSLLAKYLQKG